MLKITFTFSIMSCDWRDDQIRRLQGNSDIAHGMPSINPSTLLFKNNLRVKQHSPISLVCNRLLGFSRLQHCCPPTCFKTRLSTVLAAVLSYLLRILSDLGKRFMA